MRKEKSLVESASFSGEHKASELLKTIKRFKIHAVLKANFSEMVIYLETDRQRKAFYAKAKRLKLDLPDAPVLWLVCDISAD